MEHTHVEQVHDGSGRSASHLLQALSNGLGVEADAKAESALRIRNSKQVLVTAARRLSPAPVFFAAEGASNERIVIDGGDISPAGKSLYPHRGSSTQRRHDPRLIE